MLSAGKKIMRLGIVTSSYPLSSDDSVNAGVFVRDVAIELVKYGHEVHVLTPHKHGRADPSIKVTVKFIPWFGGEKDLASLSMRNPFNLLRFSTLVASGLWGVSRYAHRHHLEALLAMWTIPSGLFCWWAWRRYGINYGVWALGSDIWARSKYPFGDRIVRLVLHDAHFRFADGVQLARDVEQLAGSSCTFLPSVRQLPSSPATNLNLPDLDPDVIHFLFIGRYEPNKGPDLLVEAMRLLLDSGHIAHLHLFGDGSLISWLETRIRGYEKYIHLGGYAGTNALIAYMQTCNWLVIPSRIESIPLIFVDSLQMRIPVIGTDVGDLGILIRRYGVGKVVPPEDHLALSKVMQSVLSQPHFLPSQSWEAPLEVFNLGVSVKQAESALLSARADAP
jgi:glycosyltransferase involved in cell wall biosynthesis